MMDLMVWLTTLAVPLLGWWLLTTQCQRFAERLQRSWTWNQSLPRDFAYSLLLAFCHATPENHLQSTVKAPLSLQLRWLWLALWSVAFGFIFIMIFGVWNVLPPSTVLLLGLVLFIMAQWWRPAREFALFVLGVGLFLYGFEELLTTTARWRSGIDQFNWVYYLSQNFLPGALIGVFGGALIRWIFRISGVAWWTGSCLLLGGVLSLAGAWGFFLGEFLVSVVDGHLKYQERDFKWRFRIAAGFAILALILTAPFQILVMNWINGEFSSQLRSLQLAGMIFIFLFLESLLALIFFHFYFLRQRSTDLRR